MAEVPSRARMTVFDVEWTMKADGGRGPYRLSDRAIAPQSESVWVDGKRQVRDLDYLLDEKKALLTFFKDLPRGTPVVVRFRQAPRVLPSVYRRRNLPKDTPARQWNLPKQVLFQPRVQEESRLDIGGSKRIQVAFGSDRNHTLTQSLQIHISGEVAEGVELLALLSDRNLPLEGGGRTRGIQELDRVFFQVNSGSVAAGLGDLNLVFDRTEFGRYRRQLQGASLSVHRSEGEVSVFGAVSKGRWVTRRLVPVEGYQGPYRLEGAFSGTAGQVVAGSERVFLNGRLLHRGEGQDYV
ncbi:MAG: hypothetical protein O7G87_08765, partial [bacterium]|nr:hypothetical protein [bacterium]